MIQSRQNKKSLLQVADAIILDVDGLSTLTLDIVGTFVGTVIFEYTINGTDWYTLTVNTPNSATTATGATVAGKWKADVSGYQRVKVRCSAFTSGSIDVYMRAVAVGSGAQASYGIPPSVSSALSWTRFQNLGADITKNVKASAGNVRGLYARNLNGQDRFLQLHNTVTTPSVSDVPYMTFRIPSNGDILIGDEFFGELGHYFSTGIAFAFSTTEATYTAGVATDQVTHIMYI